MFWHVFIYVQNILQFVHVRSRTIAKTEREVKKFKECLTFTTLINITQSINRYKTFVWPYKLFHRLYDIVKNITVTPWLVWLQLTSNDSSLFDLASEWFAVRLERAPVVASVSGSRIGYFQSPTVLGDTKNNTCISPTWDDSIWTQVYVHLGCNVFISKVFGIVYRARLFSHKLVFLFEVQDFNKFHSRVCNSYRFLAQSHYCPKCSLKFL